MKVRMLTAISGHEYNASAGDELDLPAETAKRLLNSGQAEPVARKRASGAEKRPRAKRTESR